LKLKIPLTSATPIDASASGSASAEARSPGDVHRAGRRRQASREARSWEAARLKAAGLEIEEVTFSALCDGGVRHHR
jgi:hypothetical protein